MQQGVWMQSELVFICHSMSPWPWVSHLPSLGTTFSICKIGNPPCRFVLEMKWGSVCEDILHWYLVRVSSMFISFFPYSPSSPFLSPRSLKYLLYLPCPPFLILLMQVFLPLIPITNIYLFCPNHSTCTSLQNQTNAHSRCIQCPSRMPPRQPLHC